MKSFYFRYDIDNIDAVISYLRKKYIELEQFVCYEAPGDFVPNSVDIDLNLLSDDSKLISLLLDCDGIEI
tara:strand:+ start:14286 stop:14495 length:210 start_codon:yes stop_codon:yes gene_type:complete